MPGAPRDESDETRDVDSPRERQPGRRGDGPRERESAVTRRIERVSPLGDATDGEDSLLDSSSTRVPRRRADDRRSTPAPRPDRRDPRAFPAGPIEDVPRALEETQDLVEDVVDEADTRDLATEETQSLAQPREPAGRSAAPLRPRPSIRGLSQPDAEARDLRGEIAKRVRTVSRGAAPPSDRARLLRLLEINKALNGELELGKLLDMIMDAAISLSNARRGFLVIWDKGEARVARARNFERMKIDSPEAAISRHLIRECVDRRETVVTAEAAIERGGYASTTGLDLKSVMVSPLLSRGRVMGAIYLDDPDKVGVFQPDDIRTVEAFCDQAAIALQNAKKLEETHERFESQRFKLKRLEAEIRKHDEDAVRRFGNIVGTSPAMRKVFDLLARVSESSFPIVITGESGVGKELVAKAIHYSGPRKDGPFVATNCAAVPETLLDSELFGYVAGAFTGAERDRKGLFEQADSGTLFLDEIEEMSQAMQGKLLRVLQEGEVRRVGAKVTRKVDVRVLAATNRDLRAMVERGEFRRDLYYRLNVIPVVIPPLRERKEDVPHLVADLIARLEGSVGSGPAVTVDKDALEALTKYPWPGNVRELENELKRLLALGVRRIKISDLSSRILQPTAASNQKMGEVLSASSSGDSLPTLNLRQIERVAIEKALADAGGNKTQAAKILGLSRRGLLKKLDRYKLGSQGSDGSNDKHEALGAPDDEDDED